MILISCIQENVDDIIENDINSMNFADSVFLGFEGDLHDPELLWANMDIYSPAYERMKRFLIINDNHLRWNIKEASDINISENIFDYIVSCWETTNRKLEEGIYKLEVLENNYYTLLLINEGDNIKTKTPQALIPGWYEYNWSLCMATYYNSGCNFLSDYIGVANPEPDGFGGYRFHEKFENKTTGEWGEYYCTWLGPEFNNELNRIVIKLTDNWKVTGGDIFVWALANYQHAPLMTLKRFYIKK